MDQQTRRIFRSRKKNPDYAKIDITKALKAELMRRAKELNLSAMGFIAYMMENVVFTSPVPKKLLDQYPSSHTAYRKTWKLLLDRVEKVAVEHPGSTEEWLSTNVGNYTAKQVVAALDWLVREGRLNRTVAGFFPISTDVPE